MKRSIIVLAGVYVCLMSSITFAEPLTLDNDSVKNAGSYKVIKVKNSRSSGSVRKPPNSRNPQQRQTSPPPVARDSTGRTPLVPTAGGFSVIDVNGPQAPRIVPGIMIKEGPKKINNKTIRVVEFWATWCGPCAQTVPVLSQVQEIYGKKNVVVMGFSSEENEALVRSYVKEKGDSMNYAVRLDRERKTSGPFSAIWQVGSIPHAYVVSHKGTILWHGNPGNVRMFDRAIREAIQYRDGA